VHKLVKFFMLYLSLLLMLYPVTIQMGVKSGTIKGGVEVYAYGKETYNYSWLQEKVALYGIKNGDALYSDNISFSSVIIFGNQTLRKYIPLDDGRFFECPREAVIGKKLLWDLNYAGYNVGIGKNFELRFNFIYENKSVWKNLTFKIVGIIPSALGHFGQSILLPVDSIGIENLTLQEYILVPKKGISLKAVANYLEAQNKYIINPENSLDSMIFHVYFTLIEIFSFILGFIFLLILYEYESNKIFREYTIVLLGGGKKGRYMYHKFMQELPYIATTYIFSLFTLLLFMPQLYHYLNDIFNYLIFTFEISPKNLALTLAMPLVVILYIFIILQYKTGKFTVIEFLREGWKI